MVVGVAGRVQGGEGQAAGFHDVAVIQRGHPFGRGGQDVAPQGCHAVAVDARGGGQQLAGVDEVRRADVVDVELRPLLRPPAGCSGMVEMNVGQQDVFDVGGPETAGGQAVEDGRQGGAGAGFDQHGAVGTD